jgi:hypothetical protein
MRQRQKTCHQHVEIFLQRNLDEAVWQAATRKAQAAASNRGGSGYRPALSPNKHGELGK